MSAGAWRRAAVDKAGEDGAGAGADSSVEPRASGNLLKLRFGKLHKDGMMRIRCAATALTLIEMA